MGFDNYLISDLFDEIAMGPFGSDIKVEFFVDDGIPVLNGSNLDGFTLKEEYFRYVTKEKADSLKKANARRGDIIITHRGTLGQIVYIPETSKYDRYVISQSQFRIRCNEKVLPQFLVYYFHTRIGQHKLLVNKSQVGVPALGRPSTTFQTIEINIPGVIEQRAIADTLSCLDDKIELNNRMNKCLEEIAQALFNRWFVDFEFPNENGQPYKSSGGAMQDSKLGEIPQGWRVENVDEYFNISIGKTPPRKEPQWFTQNKNDIKWLSIANIGKSGMYILDTSEYLTNEAVHKHNVKIVPKDTVVLSFKLTIGRVAITNECITTNEAIAHFITDKKLLREYTYLYLKQFNYESLGNTSSIATAVNSKTIKSMPFLMPSEYTLKAFHEFTLNVFEIIRKNELENQTLTAIRNALLPKLMSGEIRVPVGGDYNGL